MDVEKQSYIRYYSGHERDVTSLAITASQDIFVSGSEDKTVKVWDFRKETPVGNINQSMSNPIVAFEPTGELFFVGFENRSILAYDLRSYKDNKYIDKFTFDRNPHNVPSDFKFSKDGRILLISTNGSEIMLYEADSKKHLANLTGKRSVLIRINQFFNGNLNFPSRFCKHRKNSIRSIFHARLKVRFIRV